jgi:hypothetical protein
MNEVYRSDLQMVRHIAAGRREYDNNTYAGKSTDYDRGFAAGMNQAAQEIYCRLAHLSREEGRADIVALGEDYDEDMVSWDETHLMYRVDLWLCPEGSPPRSAVFTSFEDAESYYNYRKDCAIAASFDRQLIPVRLRSAGEEGGAEE